MDPVDLELVLKTCMDKSQMHKFSRTVIGNGGIFAPGTAKEDNSFIFCFRRVKFYINVPSY